MRLLQKGVQEHVPWGLGAPTTWLQSIVMWFACVSLLKVTVSIISSGLGTECANRVVTLAFAYHASWLRIHIALYSIVLGNVRCAWSRD